MSNKHHRPHHGQNPPAHKSTDTKPEEKAEQAAPAARGMNSVITQIDEIGYAKTPEGSEGADQSDGGDDGAEQETIDNATADGGTTDAPDSPAIDPDRTILNVQLDPNTAKPAEVVEKIVNEHAEAAAIAASKVAEEVAALPPAVDVVNAMYNLDPAVVIPAGNAQPPSLHDTYELPLSCSASSRMVILELKDYIAKMNAPFKMANDEGGGAQTMLYHTLIQAINTPADDFDAVFGLTMQIIHDQANDAFNDINVHRYTPHVTLSSVQAANLRLLINSLTALANPGTREVAKRSINIEQALGSRQIKEESRQRVLNFFNF